MQATPVIQIENFAHAVPWPNSLAGGRDELNIDASDEQMWQTLGSREVPFFKLALLHQLKMRPYHVATITGPFNSAQIAQDHIHALYRSEVSFSSVGNLQIVRLLLCMGEGLFAYLEGLEMMVYGPTPQAVTGLAQKLRAYKLQTRVKQVHGFNLVGMGPAGPYAQFIEIPEGLPPPAGELEMHYGKSFPVWETGWLRQLRTKRSGLTILFGPPGTGKTSYLRSLLDRLSSEFVFYYLPVSSFEVLSSPQFVGFWVEQNETHHEHSKIAIMEDAEDLLVPRDGFNRDRVSNLLNVGDGFLGESLRLHVIATTNAPLQRWDPALVRPGRLTAMREFPRISWSEAQRIANAKGLLLPKEGQDVSLAELYCGTKGFTANRTTIGFQSLVGR